MTTSLPQLEVEEEISYSQETISYTPQRRRYARRPGETHFNLLRPAVLATIASKEFEDDETSLPLSSLAEVTCAITAIDDEDAIGALSPPLAESAITVSTSPSTKRCRRVSNPNGNSTEKQSSVEEDAEDQGHLGLLETLEELTVGQSHLYPHSSGHTKRRVSLYHDN